MSVFLIVLLNGEGKEVMPHGTEKRQLSELWPSPQLPAPAPAPTWVGRGSISEERAMPVPQISQAAVLTQSKVVWAAGDGNRVGCGLRSHSSGVSVAQLKRAVQLEKPG